MKIPKQLRDSIGLFLWGGGSKGRYFRKSLIIVMITALLPMTVVGVVNYFIGSRLVKDEVARTHSIQLKQVYDNIDRQLVHLEYIATEWAFNPLFSSDLINRDLGTDYERTFDILGALRIIEETSTLIHDVWFFLDNRQGYALLTYQDGIRYIGEDSMAESYKDLQKGPERYIWMEAGYFHRTSRVFPKVLVYQVSRNFRSSYGLLVFFLDQETMNQAIAGLYPEKQGVAFICDESGQLLASSKGAENEYKLMDVLQERIKENSNLSGSFTYKDKNESYLITVESLSRNGWRFVVATPLSRLMNPVSLMTRLLLLTGWVVLLLTVFFSLFASGNIYRPIGRLISLINSNINEDRIIGDEIKFIEERWKNSSKVIRQLHSKLESNRDVMRKGFLLQMLQGQLYFFSNRKLKEQFRDYWWDSENKCFSVLLINIFGLMENSDYHKGDEQLLNFAAANIVEEILADGKIESAVVNLQDLSLAVLLAFPSEAQKKEIKVTNLHYSEMIISILSSMLKVKIAVAVSRQTDTLADLSKVTDETLQAFRYRDMNRHEQIMEIESLILKGDMKVEYPFNLEKNILNCLRLGMEAETAAGLKDFISAIKSGAVSEMYFKQSLFQLLGSIILMIARGGFSMDVIAPGVDLYGELGEKIEVEEIVGWFADRIFKPYNQMVISVAANDTGSLIDKVLSYLDAEYKNALSLEQCADMVDMPPYQLSREFKKHTGVNFITYLTELRLKKAKELLSTTRLSVNEIAEKVGFRPTYFVSIFKKIMGITPGQYRRDEE